MTPRCSGRILGFWIAAGSLSLGLTRSPVSAAEALAPEILAGPTRPSGIYGAGEAISFRIELRGDSLDPVAQVDYTAKAFGTRVVASGKLTLKDHAAEFQTSLSEPGALLVQVHAKTESGRELSSYSGAAVDYRKIHPSMPAPADFDSFWEGKLAMSARLPLNPLVEKVEVPNEPDIDYSKVTLDNIQGSHVFGQLARPKAPGKYPAMLIVQYAGVYPLQRSSVTGRAKDGWLALNIIAHDVPFDLSEAEFKRLSDTTLKDYTAIGQTDREKSYFLRMFLGCQRAVEYLSQREDWNGRVLVATGTSQGGLQSIAAAGLDPKVTAIAISLPAGCDTTAQSAGRAFGWPYWQAHAKGPQADEIMATSRYFDAVNFARRVHCPALVGLGLQETTCPAANVFAMINSLKGPVEVLVMPGAGHQSHAKNQGLAPFNVRSAAWLRARKDGLDGLPTPTPLP